MENNKRPEKWWQSTPKIIDGKFLVVAILPDGEETTNLFSLEELAAHLKQRAPDVATVCPKCNYMAKYPLCVRCGTAIPATQVMQTVGRNGKISKPF